MEGETNGRQSMSRCQGMCRAHLQIARMIQQWIWTKDTWATRVTGHAFFKYRNLINPSVTPEDERMVAPVNLVNILANKEHTRFLTNQKIDKLWQLQTILDTATQAVHAQWDNKIEPPMAPEPRVPSTGRQQELLHRKLMLHQNQGWPPRNASTCDNHPTRTKGGTNANVCRT